MDRPQAFDCLQFDNQFSACQEIDSSFVRRMPLVVRSKWLPYPLGQFIDFLLGSIPTSTNRGMERLTLEIGFRLTSPETLRPFTASFASSFSSI